MNTKAYLQLPVLKTEEEAQSLVNNTQTMKEYKRHTETMSDMNPLFDLNNIKVPHFSKAIDNRINSYINWISKSQYHPKKVKASSTYVLNSDVLYRIQRSGLDWNMDTKQFDWQIHFVNFYDTCMGDADWIDSAHLHQESLTIGCISDLVDILEPWLIKKKLAARLYLTPGGLRWFITSKRVRPMEALNDNYFSELPYDPFYAWFSTNINQPMSTESGKTVFYQDRFYTGNLKSPALDRFAQSWACRISPKRGRNGNDFIAFPLGKLGEVKEDDALTSILYWYHDAPIERQWTKQSLRYAQELLKVKA